jgi:hypothetical protein
MSLPHAGETIELLSGGRLVGKLIDCVVPLAEGGTFLLLIIGLGSLRYTNTDHSLCAGLRFSRQTLQNSRVALAVCRDLLGETITHDTGIGQQACRDSRAVHLHSREPATCCVIVFKRQKVLWKKELQKLSNATE